jgi:hypothetical protein
MTAGQSGGVGDLSRQQDADCYQEAVARLAFGEFIKVTYDL